MSTPLSRMFVLVEEHFSDEYATVLSENAKSAQRMSTKKKRRVRLANTTRNIILMRGNPILVGACGRGNVYGVYSLGMHVYILIGCTPYTLTSLSRFFELAFP